MKKPRRHDPYCSPAVRDLIEKAKDGDRLTVVLKYHSRVKPFEAVSAYRKDVPGLQVSANYPPLLHVTGDKLRLRQALGNELTVGAVADFREYLRYLLPTPGQRERS